MSVSRTATMVEETPKTEVAVDPRQISLVGMDELIVFCPKCKTLETLCFAEDTLIRTPKFRQLAGRIYHDCGTTDPCRLYRTFRKAGQ